MINEKGAWYVCQDKGVELIQDKCIVLSFGINTDPSFDQHVDKEFKCQVESFDPFVEAGMFKSLRDQNPNAVTLQINQKWRFHRIGLVGDVKSVKNENQIGWMARLSDILEYTKLNNRVIDVFKMDIESGEWMFLLNIDMDYICKYVKQFLIESHSSISVAQAGHSLNDEEALKAMRKLEQCFLLFHRDMRFFEEGKSEFQEPITYKVDLKRFKSETKLIDHLVTFGELYFVNKEFLVQ